MTVRELIKELIEMELDYEVCFDVDDRSVEYVGDFKEYRKVYIG